MNIKWPKWCLHVFSLTTKFAATGCLTECNTNVPEKDGNSSIGWSFIAHSLRATKEALAI